MAGIIVAVLFFVLLCGLALRANARLRHEGQLPMQWWINGDVTWSAPRPIALAFIPALALPVFGCLVLLPPRPGQEGIVLPATIATGGALVAVQLFYLWLVGKTLHRNGS